MYFGEGLHRLFEPFIISIFILGKASWLCFYFWDVQDPDLVVEAIPTSSSSQPTRSSAQPTSSAGNDQTRQRSSGSNTRASGASATPASTPTSLRWDRQTVQFSVNAWVLVVAMLSMFPLVPQSLSKRAYRLSLVGTACSSLYTMYSSYGIPRAWNLQAVQVWFQSVIATKDFIYTVYCLTFVTSQSGLKFALLPILCRALEHVTKFLRRNFSRSSLYRKYVEDICVWVDSNTATLNILSTQAEIGIGFLQLIWLFSWQRNLVQTFMYWQLLKLMYHVPVTASYHKSAWAKIGRTVIPLATRYAPFMSTPIAAVQKWWLR